MQFSELWLREFVDPPLTSAELAHSLTMAGLEVEALTNVAPAFSGVVVAQVLAVDNHPDADKLKLCRVDAGQGETLQIVCGAPNVAAGMKVPCALLGAELPGMKIKAAKVRGVESFGMLCSSRELGLSEDHSGLMALPADAPVGEDIRAYLSTRRQAVYPETHAEPRRLPQPEGRGARGGGADRHTRCAASDPGNRDFQ